MDPSDYDVEKLARLFRELPPGEPIEVIDMEGKPLTEADLRRCSDRVLRVRSAGEIMAEIEWANREFVRRWRLYRLHTRPWRRARYKRKLTRDRIKRKGF